MQVPEGWKYNGLDCLAANDRPAIKAGPFGSSLKKEFYVKSGYKVYGQEQVIANDAFLGDYFIDQEKYDELSSCSVQAGDILISLVGTIGRVLRLPENCLAGIINPRLLRISLDKTKADSCYFEYLLSSTTIAKSLARMSQGGTMGVLNAGTLKQINLLIPPLDEQQKIAQILSTWDKAITTTEQLLTNSQQQKKALMQQLLTGKKRLLDNNGQRFGGEWKSFLLEELEELGRVSLGRGKVISKKDIENIPGQYPIYSSSVKNDGLMGAYGEYMFDEELISWSVDGGGNFFHRKKHKFSVTNVSGYMRLDADYLNYKFVASQLGLHHARLEFDYQTKAHPSVIRKLYRLSIPSLKEQQKIATVLTAADQEITQLQQKLDQLKQEKKALMQQLLTGKRRVQIN